jgi:porin
LLLHDQPYDFLYLGKYSLGCFYGCFVGVFLLLAPISSWAIDGPEHLDEWKLFRSDLNARGVTLETVNTTDVGSNLNHEGRNKALIIGDIDLLLTLDTDKLIGWNGGTAFVYGLGLYGGNIAEGRDAQGVSNISGNNTWKLFEAWYQQNLLQERLSLLVGLYDVTSEFDVISSASELFINSSFGTNPTVALSGKNGPSTFPNVSLGFRAQAKLTENITLRAVVADGVPGDPPDNPDTLNLKLSGKDGILFATEVAYYVGKPDDQETDKQKVGLERPNRLVFRRLGRAAELEYDAKFALGSWLYTTDQDDLSKQDGAGNPLERDETYGFYALGEKRVYEEQGPGEQGLWVFGEVAYANPKVNRFSQYYGGGLMYQGLIPGRDLDQTGFGFAIVRNGRHYKDGQRQEGQRVSDQEIALEWSHAIYLSPALTIQPDVQYIIHPNTDPTRNNALVLLMRLQLTMNWFQ